MMMMKWTLPFRNFFHDHHQILSFFSEANNSFRFALGLDLPRLDRYASGHGLHRHAKLVRHLAWGHGHHQFAFDRRLDSLIVE